MNGFDGIVKLQALVLGELLATIWGMRAFFCLQGPWLADDV